MTVLYDLSPTLSAKTPVWPGDQPLRVERLQVLERTPDEIVNLSALLMTPHLGAHADAPLHTERDGRGIALMELDRYLGPCAVVDARDGRAEITAEVLRDVDLDTSPRILFKTGAPAERDFPHEVKPIAPTLAQHLVISGALLVGTDEPSIDPIDSRELAAHHALLGQGIAVLEGLVLEGVPAGRYELVALPLKLDGVDASPVRAVLVEALSSSSGSTTMTAR